MVEYQNTHIDCFLVHLSFTSRFKQKMRIIPPLTKYPGFKKVVNSAVNTILQEERTSDKLLNRILQDGAIDIRASFDIPVEEQKLKWTTYEYLKLWFDTWAL